MAFVVLHDMRGDSRVGACWRGAGPARPPVRLATIDVPKELELTRVNGRHRGEE